MCSRLCITRTSGCGTITTTFYNSRSSTSKSILVKLSSAVTSYVHPTGGVDILLLLCLASRLVSGHFKEKYLSYLYQILLWVFIGLIACMGLVKIAL